MKPLPSDYADFDPYHSTSWDRINYQVETTARLYLDFALKDLESERDERTLVNALSNAKRALHLQVETLAKAFGFSGYSKKRRPNFHDFLEYCEKCGIVTPRILKKLNSVRNAVEQDYYIPSEHKQRTLWMLLSFFWLLLIAIFTSFQLSSSFCQERN